MTMSGYTGTSGAFTDEALENREMLESRVDSLLGNESHTVVKHGSWNVCPTDDHLRSCDFHVVSNEEGPERYVQVDLRRMNVIAQQTGKRKPFYVLNCADVGGVSLSSDDYKPLVKLGKKVFGRG